MSCCPNPRPYRSCGRTAVCIEGVIGFFALLVGVALGLIFGTVYAETLLPNLGALIVLAVIAAAIIVALLIYRCTRTD